MPGKQPLNIEWIHFHIREALGELRELEALLEYLETGKKGEWLSTVDDERFYNDGKTDDSALEIHLCASLAHAYHHMNFGWNSRRCKSTRKADDRFSKMQIVDRYRKRVFGC